MPDLNLIESYHYELPETLIAQFPTEQRDQSRLMVLDRETGEIEHRQFFHLPEYLNAGDCLVLNQTRVVPARLKGVRDKTGGKWEGLFLSLQADGAWEILSKTKGKLQPGETVTVHSNQNDHRTQIEFIEKGEQGHWKVKLVDPLCAEETIWELLDKVGSIPLPPYIRQGEAKAEDKLRYQSVYASLPGAAAAPTAGLHFSQALIEQCKAKGISIVFVTLHVGLGTFRPVLVNHLDEHEMHSEWCEVDQQAVEKIQQTKQQGGRVIAVGTTSVRSLETAAQPGEIQPWTGESNLFIRPGFKFQVVDGLVTNYHLPKSTLLVLLSAFAGYGKVMKAYQIAIEEQYRFFSYGDAMLVLTGESS